MKPSAAQGSLLAATDALCNGAKKKTDYFMYPPPFKDAHYPCYIPRRHRHGTQLPSSLLTRTAGLLLRPGQELAPPARTPAAADVAASVGRPRCLHHHGCHLTGIRCLPHAYFLLLPLVPWRELQQQQEQEQEHPHHKQQCSSCLSCPLMAPWLPAGRRQRRP